MIPRAALAALLYATSAAAVCTKLEDCPQFEKLKTNQCQKYHHFLARGSTSPYPGHVIETVGKVCAQLNTNANPNDCGYEDIEYWAMNGGERWCISAHEGAMNGAAQMQNYTQRCPDSHLIMMGFSQGGSVTLDVIGGGGGELWGCMQKDNPPMNISSAPGSKVAAVVTFGATRRSANQSYTFGGGQVSDGGAPRSPQELAGLQTYANAGKLREYCQPRDPICAPHTENTDMSFHLDYFDKWGTEAADWVVSKAREASGDKPSGASPLMAHPIANVFILIFVVLALYFIVRKIAVWRTSSPRYAPVNTNDAV